MSLKPSPTPPVPEVTACVARAAFPHGNTIIQLHDTLVTVYTDERYCQDTAGEPLASEYTGKETSDRIGRNEARSAEHLPTEEESDVSQVTRSESYS
jgi:hypothetical protein